MLVRRSEDAGSFYCDKIFGCAIRKGQDSSIERGAHGPLVGFLHLPQDIPAAEMVAPVAAIVSALLAASTRQRPTILLTGFGWFYRLSHDVPNPSGQLVTAPLISRLLSRVGNFASPQADGVCKQWLAAAQASSPHFADNRSPVNEGPLLAEDWAACVVESDDAKVIAVRLPSSEHAIDPACAGSIDSTIDCFTADCVLCLGLGRDAYDIETNSRTSAAGSQTNESLWRAWQAWQSRA